MGVAGDTGEGSFRAIACLLPVISGGGIPLFGYLNPFWQIVFGSGGYLAEFVLPDHDRGSAWHFIGLVAFPWLIIALLHVVSGRVWLMNSGARRLCIAAYFSSFLTLVPGDQATRIWPSLSSFPFYVGLFD